MQLSSVGNASKRLYKEVNLPIFILQKFIVLAIYNSGEKSCLGKQLSVYIEIPPKTLVLNGIIGKVS